MKIKVLAGALVASAALTGCASIFAGGPAKIDITSTPGDAAVTITNADGAVVFNGTTPTTAELARSRGFFSAERYTVTIEKPGVGSETVQLSSTANGWTFGNLLLGGIIGIVIDGTTGAIFAYTPKDIDVTLGQSASLDVKSMDMLSDEERETLVPIS